MLHWEEYWQDSEFKKIAEEYRQLYIDGNHTGDTGFVGFEKKKQMYQLKCWMEDLYEMMPEFAGEEEFEKQRIYNVLKFKKGG